MQTFLTSVLGARRLSDSHTGYFNTGAIFFVAIGEEVFFGGGVEGDKMVEK